MRLDKKFFAMPATELAPALLGKFLCRSIGGEILRARITETESYFGTGDTACHASKGKTARTEVMFRSGGAAYIYLCYGIHNLLNIVSGVEGHPEAVLIRCLEGFPGPGRLTKAFQIGRDLNGENLINSDLLWVEDDGYTCEYKTAKRVGIDYAAEEDRERLWRFIMI